MKHTILICLAMSLLLPGESQGQAVAPTEAPSAREAEAGRERQRQQRRGRRRSNQNDAFYKLGADSKAQEGVPQGKFSEAKVIPSHVFPGTQHTYWVYVPAQYDPSQPAAVMVFNDGQAMMAEPGDVQGHRVLDNLIYRREIPVMLGVFINPGRRPDQPEPTPRDWGDRTTNRTNEYNPPNENYGRVIVEELMPALQKEYNISTNPDQHGIMGSSSGGCAAFATAWFRPNHFRKVITFVGSYTDIRGEHIYPELVAAAEKKPIRIFLQDGRNDNRRTDNPNKDWFLQNVRLKDALEAKGYDLNYTWGIGNHGQKQGGAIFPSMMRWLWRDHPVSTDPNNHVDRSFRKPTAEASSAVTLQPFVDKHELAGAVALVATKDKVLSIEAVGFSNVGEAKAMKTDAMFWIASQSKGMTAAAVMMLVDEGKIALDDPVEKYLPEFRGQRLAVKQDNGDVLLQKPSHPITIREVLSHVSGLPFQSDIEKPTLDALPLAAAVRSYAMTPLQTEPGTHYQYSNAGINTAARILEVVSGLAYEDFMQQRLFDPLEMTDTTFWPNKEQVARLAKSYRPDKAKTNLEEFPFSQLTYPLTDRSRRFPMPAGGLFSTARDTVRFCQMLLNGGELDGKRYLSEAATTELTKRQTPTSVKESYGLGLTVSPNGFGHGGAHATNMEMRPDKGLAFIWMVQHGGFPGEGGNAQGVFKDWAMKRFGE
mgnify:CR=1 FL=1